MKNTACLYTEFNTVFKKIPYKITEADGEITRDVPTNKHIL